MNNCAYWYTYYLHSLDVERAELNDEGSVVVTFLDEEDDNDALSAVASFAAYAKLLDTVQYIVAVFVVKNYYYYSVSHSDSSYSSSSTLSNY